MDGTSCNPVIENCLKNLLMRVNRGVGRNSKQRSILCDTVLGKTLCEFGSAHEKLMSLREGLHVMMECYMRQQDACPHPTSWREPTMRKSTKESTTYFVKGPVCRWNVHKMRSESSEHVRKTTGFFTNSWRIKIALESYFEEHAQEVWERNWMNPEMPTTLLNTYALFNDSEGALRTTQRE